MGCGLFSLLFGGKGVGPWELSLRRARRPKKKPRPAIRAIRARMPITMPAIAPPVRPDGCGETWTSGAEVFVDVDAAAVPEEVFDEVDVELDSVVGVPVVDVDVEVEEEDVFDCDVVLIVEVEEVDVEVDVELLVVLVVLVVSLPPPPPLDSVAPPLADHSTALPVALFRY